MDRLQHRRSFRAGRHVARILILQHHADVLPPRDLRGPFQFARDPLLRLSRVLHPQEGEDSDLVRAEILGSRNGGFENGFLPVVRALELVRLVGESIIETFTAYFASKSLARDTSSGAKSITYLPQRNRSSTQRKPKPLVHARAFSKSCVTSSVMIPSLN